MKKIILLLSSVIFLLSSPVVANEALIGSWEKDDGTRMDIIGGFKSNVGPVIYWDSEDMSETYTWKVNPNTNEMDIYYWSGAYSFLDNGNLRWGNNTYQKINSIEQVNAINIKNDSEAFINALTLSEWSSDFNKSEQKEFTKTFSSTSGILSEFDSDNKLTVLSEWGVASGVLKIASSVYVESIISDKYLIAVDADDSFLVLSKGGPKKMYERISLKDSREQFLSSLTSGAWMKKGWYTPDSIYRFRPIEGELKGRVFKEQDRKLESTNDWEYSPATGAFKSGYTEYLSGLNIGNLLVFVDKDGKQSAFSRDNSVELKQFSYTDVVNIPVSERSTTEIQNILSKQMSIGSGNAFTLFEFNDDNRTGYFHEWESYPFQITGQSLKVDDLYSQIEQIYLIEDYVIFGESFSKKIDTRESRMKPKTTLEAKEDSLEAIEVLDVESKTSLKIKIEFKDGTSKTIPIPVSSLLDLKSITVITQ